MPAITPRGRRATRAALWGAFAIATVGASTQAHAATPQDVQGLWRSADQRAVIAFAPCRDNPAHLCGTIAWDADVGTPADTCGVVIARLKRFEDDAWRDGWAHDPRSKKTYKAVLRTQGDTLKLRAFIGTELLGETEEMKRATALPAGCPAQR